MTPRPPDLSPDDFLALGYRAVDMLAQMLADIPTAPARRPMPDAVRDALLHQPTPTEPHDAAELLEVFARDVLPYPMGSVSPRFFAWVNGPPGPLGALADMLAAAMNSSATGGDHSSTYVEHAVLRWLKAWIGYPADAGAILVTGGSVANLIGLAVMRTVKAQGSVRAQGLYSQTAPMVIYASTQGHTAIQKAVELLGFGSDYFRKIPVDSDFRMDVQALREQIAADRAAGLRPVCVAASAGTVNTGALDPFAAIADLCAAEDLWFHIDGAYGGVGILARQTDGLYDGMTRADSLAIDPHKWMSVPIECGCAFVRDARAMRDTFSLVPAYLRDDNALPWFSEFGIQQTRGFRALKLWFMMQQVGLSGYRDLISRDIDLARALQARIRARPDFELVSAGPLSITCFRYTPPDLSDPAHIDRLNRALLARVQQEGHVFLSHTELNGRPVLRACIINFRTEEADLDTLLNTIAQAGQTMQQNPIFDRA